MGNTVEVTGYGQGAAVIEDGPLADTVSDVGFSSREADEVAERTMHGNLVYDMAEEESQAELLPDPEVYEAARRIDEQRWLYRFTKRAFDIVFSGMVLVVFCWLFAIIALVIKVDSSEGPVIFSQDRVGKNGMPFRMYKFRTMIPDAEKQLDSLLERNEKTGPVFKISADPRILASGIWLRKLSLDELPQFWNVFKGDIPLRILKMRQVFSEKKLGAFALPANEVRADSAAFMQVKGVIRNYLLSLQKTATNFIRSCDNGREFFAKRGFGANRCSNNVGSASGLKSFVLAPPSFDADGRDFVYCKAAV